MDRDPPIGLHPDLRAYALSLLRENIPITQIQQLCKKWTVKRWDASSMGDNTHWHRLNGNDASSLYRAISRERGILQRTAAEDNLDNWFRHDSPTPPHEVLPSSVLYYHPCSTDNDRLVLVIATPEMQEAAWKYGHKGHVLTELTFGFSSARANLLILMALDDNHKGVPIGLIIFTAKPGTKAIYADYDTKLIHFLLEKWRQGLGKNESGSDFRYLKVYAAMTDNDSQERTVLQDIWPGILLILCMFHIWQAWRNSLNKHLRVIPKGDNQITQYPNAIAAYNAELDYFKALTKKPNAISKAQGKGGLAFLNYLGSYLQVRSFWLSWSKAGVIKVAMRLGVPLNKVPRTNNHLKSFNGRIKNKYFEPYKHTGRLPRLDLWVLLIITKVIPNYFEQLWDHQAQHQYYIAMRKALSCIRGTSSARLPALDHESLLSPDNSTASNQDAAEEYEMVDEMVDGDVDSDSECDHDHEEVKEACELHDFGAQPFQIDSDGEGCSIAEAVLRDSSGEEMADGGFMDLGFVEGGDATMDNSESYEEDSMHWPGDNALGSENILDGLRSLSFNVNHTPLPPPSPAPLAPLDMNRLARRTLGSPAGTLSPPSCKCSGNGNARNARGSG
ncbi:hypothetical protein BDZ94DRAFT_1303652 [Collybia nuda]|uniref:MULE transposase domain-containing protein n=1 Tax=Collybia nuda TaxID=64659 RepID=A0A9P5YKA2_9AGAR|nr:hypothetical protein BDZ94DRAFT_1303652 [Collybia nuda]